MASESSVEAYTRALKMGCKCLERKFLNNQDTVNVLNTSCLLKRSRQTGQTRIRLLLKKQSDQALLCLLF